MRRFPENVNASNVERLLTGVDCVVDGLDNMVTRYLVNRACVKLKIPYVFGAAIGIEGNLSVFAPPETGCLECLMPNLSDYRFADVQHPRRPWSNNWHNRLLASHGNHKTPSWNRLNFERQTAGLRLQRHGFHQHRHLKKHPLPRLPWRLIFGCWRRTAGLALRKRHS